MPDITMCHGEDCPLKYNCFRNLAVPNKLQSYFSKTPFINGSCDYFSDVEEVEMHKFEMGFSYKKKDKK